MSPVQGTEPPVAVSEDCLPGLRFVLSHSEWRNLHGPGLDITRTEWPAMKVLQGRDERA